MITSATRIAVLGYLILLSWAGTAQVNSSIYLDYNGSCMNRFEYQYESNGDVSTGYEKYQAFTTKDVRLLLDVGVEKGEWVDIKPEHTRKCGTILFDKELARSVNANEDRLFIVKPDEGGYRVIPVRNVEVFEYVGDIIKFQDGDVSFDFQVGGLTEMQVDETSENTTYFKSEHGLPCQKEIVFREFLSDTESTYSEVHLMAQLGLIYREEVASQGGSYARADYTIVKGNGHTINHFVADACEGIVLNDPILEVISEEESGGKVVEQSEPKVQIITEEEKVPATPPSSSHPEVKEGEVVIFLPLVGEDGNYEELGDDLAAKGEETLEEAPKELYHTIEKGDTLFSLAKKHGTTVPAIEALNPTINARALSKGQTIRIK